MSEQSVSFCYQNIQAFKAQRPNGSSYKKDIGEVVEYIIQKTAPQIISFGEFHTDCELSTNSDSKYRSTMEVFAEKVLPQLKKYGFNDLVLEFLVNEPALLQDLENFYTKGIDITRETTPVLYGMCEICELKGLKELLIKARLLGIRIHPGGPSLRELHSPEIMQERADRGKDWLPITSKLTSDTLQKKTLELVRLGKKVAVYNGLWHNDIEADVPESSFGDDFSLEFENRYVEVDLVSRQRLHEIRYSKEGCPPYPRIHDYMLVSKSRMENACFNPSQNSFVIVFRK